MNTTAKLYGLLGLALLWLLSLAVAFHQGGLATRKDVAEKEAERNRALVALSLKELELATQRESEVRVLLREVQVPVTKLERIIDENPSHCVVPDAVRDGVQDAIRDTNARIRSTL